MTNLDPEGCSEIVDIDIKSCIVIGPEIKCLMWESVTLLCALKHFHKCGFIWIRSWKQSTFMISVPKGSICLLPKGSICLFLQISRYCLLDLHSSIPYIPAYSATPCIIRVQIWGLGLPEKRLPLCIIRPHIFDVGNVPVGSVQGHLNVRHGYYLILLNSAVTPA